MRPSLLSFVCALALVAPARAQICRQTQPPSLPSLFPESIETLAREFSLAPGVGCMALYRSSEAAALWAVLSAEANTSLPLGESAESLAASYRSAGKKVVVVDDWPVAVDYLPKGDEFVTLRGSVKIIVLVKNGDQGDQSEALAAAFFRAVLPGVPCGS